MNDRLYSEYPLGFENRNIAKMAERNALVKTNESQKQTVENIVETVENLKDKMNAEQFINFVYELTYNLDSGNIQKAQNLLNGIGFEGEIKDSDDNAVAKAAVFELLILFADKKMGINIDKDDDIDDMRNVANILTAA